MREQGNISMGVSRRHFISTTITASLAAGTVTGALCNAEAKSTSGVPLRALGSTGVKVSAIGLGGYHMGSAADEQTAIRIVRSAIDKGITFMDNCWDYHNGKSEQWMGNALGEGYREKVFLMTKLDGHNKELAARQIDESLQRLKTDHVDLMQFHEVIRPDDPEKIFAPGGSMEAMLEARKAGKVRFIGFTGHKDPEIHLHMLRMARENGIHLDAVQMPLNVMDAHYKSFEKKVLPVLLKEKIGVLGMKSMASGHILRSKTVSPTECLQYALSLPTSVVITGIDKIELVDQAVEAASRRLGRKEVAALLAKTAEYAMDGKYEPFKTTTEFDGTAKHPQWLGEKA